jgi:cytochrome b
MNNHYKTYVWSFLGRLSHWLLVISFFISFITSFHENLLKLHVTFGIIALGMFIKKIVWGLIGPKYARWSDYKFKLKDLNFYFVEKIRNRYRKIEPGHNPASSWFAFLVTWFGIFCCLIGLLLYGIQEGNGIFSFLNTTYYMYMENLFDIHEVLSYILLVMILTHISGVLIEQFYHKTSMVFAMITGYKKAKGEDIEPTFCMKFYGSLYIVFVLSLASYTYYIPNNFIVKSKFEKIDYKKLHSDFQFECSDCHNLIPPFLLPKESWKNLMANQDNHFEEDLELDSTMVKSIEKFLIRNSSESSTRESSYKITKELSNSNAFIITKTDYWKKLHEKIPEEVFKSDTIETKSNCIACHKDFEKGILADINITFLSK